jgi:hypothetical protein
MFTYIQLEIKNDKYDDEKNERRVHVNEKWGSRRKTRRLTKMGRRMCA